MPTIGLVYDLFGSYPLRPDDPPDAESESRPLPDLLAQVLGPGLARLGLD